MIFQLWAFVCRRLYRRRSKSFDGRETNKTSKRNELNFQSFSQKLRVTSSPHQPPHTNPLNILISRLISRRNTSRCMFEELSSVLTLLAIKLYQLANASHNLCSSPSRRKILSRRDFCLVKFTFFRLHLSRFIVCELFYAFLIAASKARVERHRENDVCFACR